MTLIVNMVAGPGTGKSTTAAGTFAELKQRGVNCELVTEYAKDLVWGRTTTTLGNQIYLFGKQYHRLWRLLDQVDVIITDSPLFLFMYYGRKQSEAYKNLVMETWRGMDNMVIYLHRLKEFNPAGRTQDEAQAREIDRELKDMLIAYNIDYGIVSADRTAAEIIANMVETELGRRT